MSANSSIEWTDATWNPVRGCTKVSAGCKNCYAERFAERWRGIKGHPFEQGFDVRLVPEALELPLKWRKPRRIFVNSVSDLFHKDVPFRFIHEVWGIMRQTPQHTYQILTKRADRMLEVVSQIRAMEAMGYAKGFYSHVHLGVSVEDQRAADERIPHLLKTPAAVRFLSCEPLLGPVDLQYPAFNGADSLGRLEGLHWAIAGGESGPGARPMHPDWARSLRDQCQAAGVPFFFKQWGEWTPGENVPDDRRYPSVIHFNGKWDECTDDWLVEQDHGPILYRVGKAKAGRLLDGSEHNEFPRSK